MRNKTGFKEKVWIVALIFGLVLCAFSFAPKKVVSDEIFVVAHSYYAVGTPPLIGRVRGKIYSDSIRLVTYVLDSDNFLNWKNKQDFESTIATKWTKEYEFDLDVDPFEKLFLVFYNSHADPNYPVDLKLEIVGIAPTHSPFLYIGVITILVGAFIKKRVKK
jgi:hypothetical protein